MNSSEIILYTTPQGHIKVEVILQDETVWLTQKAMAELFGVDRTVITKHLGNIFKEGELSEDSVCAKIAHTLISKSTNSSFIIHHLSLHEAPPYFRLAPG
jgi:hypothetical protein